MDVLKKLCKLSIKRVTRVQYVIIALSHTTIQVPKELWPYTQRAARVYYNTRLAGRKRRGFHSTAAPGEPQYLFQVELGVGLMGSFILPQLGGLEVLGKLQKPGSRDQKLRQLCST